MAEEILQNLQECFELTNSYQSADPSEYEQINQQLYEATNQLTSNFAIPGAIQLLCENLINFDPILVLFSATQLLRAIKQYWQNDEIIGDKAEIRQNILHLLFEFSENSTITTNFLQCVTFIINCDYPGLWPDLNDTLLQQLKEQLSSESPNFGIIDAVLCVAQSVCSKKDDSRRRSLFQEREEAVAYWGEQIVKLLTQDFATEEFLSEDFGPQIYLHTLQVFNSLISQSLDDIFLPHLVELFNIFSTFNKDTQLYDIKSEIFTIGFKFISYFPTEVFNAKNKLKALQPQQNQQPQEEEEEENEIVEAYFGFLTSIIESLGDEEMPLTTKGNAFKAITSMIKIKIVRENFFSEEIFSQVTDIIFETLALSEEEVEDMENDPVQYFINDTQGLEDNPTAKKAAYSLMKTMARFYRDEFNSLFEEMYDLSIAEKVQENPDLWPDYDRIITFTGFIVAERTSFRDGVTNVIEGFDLGEFVTTLILPALSPDFPYKILQADAVKFYVDYRNVIPSAEITAPNFQLFFDMMLSSSISTKLYGSYLIENLLKAKYLQIDSEFLATKNIKAIVAPLLQSLVYDGRPLETLASTLTTILAIGAESLREIVSPTIKTLLSIIDSGKKSVSDINFYHYVFESIAACLIYIGVNITEVEERLLQTLDSLITEDIIDFIPYAIQLYGSMIECYPEGAEINPGMFERFVNFLDPQFWSRFGNIPALAMLISHYANRVPELVAEHEEHIIGICDDLLKSSRTHQSAFSILLSLVRKGTTYLQQIVDVAFSHIGENIPRYRYGLGLFFSKTILIVGPEVFISTLNGNDDLFKEWGDSLSMVRKREDYLNVVEATLEVLGNAESITSDQWGYLFVGLFNFIENKARDDSFNEEIQARKDDEEAAKQFDAAFARLKYSEKPVSYHHLAADTDIIRYFATQMAEISQVRGDYLVAALQSGALSDTLRDQFLRFQEKYEVSYAI